MTQDGTQPEVQHRRRIDGWLARGAAVWDWIDNRDIDKHVTALGIIIFLLERTVRLIAWGFKSYEAWIAAVAAGHPVSGVEVAAVIAAVTGPWSAVLAVVIPLVVSFYFKART